jgi:hypothetical protein
MKRTVIRDFFVAATVSLVCAGGARACYVELSWSADQFGNAATLIATFASSTPVTPATYTPLDETNQLLGLQLSIHDKRTDAVLADIDLQQTLQANAELLAMLSEVSKQLLDMQMNVIERVVGVTASSADVWAGQGLAPQRSEHTLVLTSSRPGFESIYVPLECQGACGGEYSSSWAFERYVPEPGTLALAPVALGVLWLTMRRRKGAEV